LLPRETRAAAAVGVAESVVPMSDDEAMAQVVDPAKQIVNAAGLQEPTGGFAFESCNDQGEPPYRPVAEVGFLLPKDMEPEKYFAQIAKTMVGRGWTDGPPLGLKPFGTVVHKGSVMVIMAQHPTYRENGYAQLSGECRNMVDHNNDGKTTAVDITDQLRQR
jgi:hypothetical protein